MRADGGSKCRAYSARRQTNVFHIESRGVHGSWRVLSPSFRSSWRVCLIRSRLRFWEILLYWIVTLRYSVSQDRIDVYVCNLPSVNSRSALLPFWWEMSSRKDHLIRHVSEQHVKVRCFACESCNFSTHRRDLERHVYTRHGDRIKCRQCGRGYDTDDELQGHIQSKHVIGKNHVCKDCGSRYTTKARLKDHQRNEMQCRSRRK